MSNKRRRFLSVFTAAVLLFVFSGISAPASVHADTRELVYVALGDSVSYGMSVTVGNGYTELFKTYLDGYPKYSMVDHRNLSVPGFTAEELYRQVKDRNYAELIHGADIITVNIGGNNILGAVVGLVKSLYPEAPDTLEGLNQAVYTDPSRIAAILEKLKDPTSPESMALTLALASGVTSFKLYYPLLLKEIRALAPDAEIYVNTLYSPVESDSDIAMLLNPYIHSINLSIRAYQFRYSYKVVDVYSAFRITAKKVVEFNITDDSFNVDIHPNDEGHSLIFRTLKLRLWSARSRYYYS